MKKNIQPLGKNVLVAPLKAETKTKTGIVIPDSASGERPQEGRVIAIGDSKDIKVKTGQKIIFAKYSGTEIQIEKEEYLIIKNEDILATIE